MRVRLYPNDSTTTYDKHRFDAPIGLETDITFVFTTKLIYFKMLSTLSTGLNKSDEFIKDNAVNTYVRTIKFDNDTNVHLTEETSIPASEIPVRRYVRCSTFLYLNDIRICHFTLTCFARCEITIVF